MCNPVLIAYGAMAAATVYQGYAQKQQGEYTNKVAKYNARQEENEATRTRNIGVEAENMQREKTAQLLSRQRAQLGAANVDLSTGSPLQLQADTQLLGEVDALRIKENYQTQAQVLQDKSLLTRAQGRAAQSAGNTAFTTSIFKAAATMFGGYASGAFSGASGASTAMTTANAGSIGYTPAATMTSANAGSTAFGTGISTYPGFGQVASKWYNL